MMNPANPCVILSHPWARRIALGAVLLILSAGHARGDEPRRGDRDLRALVKARRAIHQDRELERFPLIVLMRRGRAVLHGELPSESLVEKAREVVSKVPGVSEVESRLLVREEAPTHVASAGEEKSFLKQWWIGGEYRSFEELRKPEPVTQLSSRVETEHSSELWGNPLSYRSPNARVALMTPRPQPRKTEARTVAKPARGSLTVSGSLGETLKNLRQSDSAYSRLRIEEEDGVVLIRGRVRDGATLSQLTDVISRLPGVKRARVRGIRFDQ